MLLTSFLSCRHSSTDRLFVQVCFGHSRVTSSRQACSSASFQPVDLLDWAPEDAAAAAALFPGFGSAALNCWCMATAGGWTFPKPGRGLRACMVSRQRDMRSSSSWTRLHAAIFNHKQLNRAPLFTLPLKTPRWRTNLLRRGLCSWILMTPRDASPERFIDWLDYWRL